MGLLPVRSIVGAAALQALLGCGAGEPTATGGPEPALAAAWDAWPARTDSLVYRLRREAGAYRAYATVALRNRTGGPLYFARCTPGDAGPMYGLRRTGLDSAATLFVDWAWACVGGVPTGELRPGDSLVVRVPLGSVDQPHMSPPLRPEHLVGLLRVWFRLCRTSNADSDYCDPAPQSESQSNAFDVGY